MSEKPKRKVSPVTLKCRAQNAVTRLEDKILKAEQAEELRLAKHRGRMEGLNGLLHEARSRLEEITGGEQPAAVLDDSLHD